VWGQGQPEPWPDDQEPDWIAQLGLAGGVETTGGR
ncbi:MAG TPA: HIT family protein, partial [Alcanivorax sp.]|nr:HIT family protein [Alcanivorax sp.]